MTILQWFEHWEPIWLFIILFVETGIGFLTLLWIIREYKYDKEKDDAKKQKRTRTTKKTTTKKDGDSVTEESVEVLEPMAEPPKDLPHD